MLEEGTLSSADAQTERNARTRVSGVRNRSNVQSDVQSDIGTRDDVGTRSDVRSDVRGSA